MTREYLGAADFAARADLATATIRTYERMVAVRSAAWVAA